MSSISVRQSRWTSRSFGRLCSAFKIAACHFPGQILEALGLERPLVELAPLVVAHLGERRVADDLVDAAAELGAGQWMSPTI
jgi:hypothetical protein